MSKSARRFEGDEPPSLIAWPVLGAKRPCPLGWKFVAALQERVFSIAHAVGVVDKAHDSSVHYLDVTFIACCVVSRTVYRAREMAGEDTGKMWNTQGAWGKSEKHL